MYEVDLVWVCRGWEVPIISYSMSPVRNPLKILQPSPPPLEQWYGMVLWQIWLPAMVEGFTTLSIGMKWIWYEYAGDGRSQSYPTAYPQWEPHSESYYQAHPFGVMVWYGAAPLRPPTTYKAWQTLCICMKWIWYEYEVDGRSQSYPTAYPQWEPHSESYSPAHPFGVMVWYGVAPLRPPTTYKAWQTLCICMKWIWYEYEVDGRS
jgi:hypothetical protein